MSVWYLIVLEQGRTLQCFKINLISNKIMNVGIVKATFIMSLLFKGNIKVPILMDNFFLFLLMMWIWNRYHLYYHVVPCLVVFVIMFPPSPPPPPPPLPPFLSLSSAFLENLHYESPLLFLLSSFLSDFLLYFLPIIPVLMRYSIFSFPITWPKKSLVRMRKLDHEYWRHRL